MPRTFSDAARRELEEEILPKYPNKQAALLSTLWLAEKDFGVVDPEAMKCVADALALAPAHVYGVFTFYTLFRREGHGKFVLDVCATLPCALRGARDIVHYLEEKLGVQPGQTTPDGLFTLRKVECLAACDKAPVMEVGDQFYGPLTTDQVDEVLAQLRADAEADKLTRTCGRIADA